jgi:hypothetical protein
MPLIWKVFWLSTVCRQTMFLNCLIWKLCSVSHNVDLTSFSPF